MLNRRKGGKFLKDGKRKRGGGKPSTTTKHLRIIGTKKGKERKETTSQLSNKNLSTRGEGDENTKKKRLAARARKRARRDDGWRLVRGGGEEDRRGGKAYGMDGWKREKRRGKSGEGGKEVGSEENGREGKAKRGGEEEGKDGEGEKEEKERRNGGLRGG